MPTEGYRQLRNTVKYLLSNVSDFDPVKDAVKVSDMPELERFMLHRLGRLQAETLADYERYQFRAAARRLLDFCSFDLSSFYLDILKDRLYTSAKAEPARRAAQTVMAEALRRVLLLAAPIISFTAEEGWSYGPGRWGFGESVFLADLPLPEGWDDAALAARWEQVLVVRHAAQKVLEEARAAKTIGKSLEARVALAGPEWITRFTQWPEVLIVSEVETRVDADLSASVEKAGGVKCARCWRLQKDVGADAAHPEVCGRCAGQLKAR